MDMLKKMIEEWKKELIEAGEIDPSEELSQQEIQLKYQDYQIKKMKSAMGDIGKSLGIEIPEEDKQKNKKPSKPEPKKPQEKKKIGRPESTKFSQILNEIQDLQKSLEKRFIHNSELFNALCSSSSSELLETINDHSKRDSVSKMKDIQEIIKKLTSKSENGFPAPADFEDEFTEYINRQDKANEELKLIYSQIEKKSKLMFKLISELEEA